MNLPTLLIVLALAAIAVYTVIAYRKKLASGCCGTGGDRVRRVRKAGRPEDYPCHRVVTVEGMHCDNCAARVENAFNALDGVTARVNLGRKRADIYSREPLDDGRIRQIVAQAGYAVSAIE